MVLIDKYFKGKKKECLENLEKEVKNYQEKDNKIQAEIEDYKTEIILNKDTYKVKCTCGDKNCEHIYKTLLKHEIEQNKRETEYLEEAIEYKSTKRKKHTIYLEKLLKYNIDTYYNTHTKQNLESKLFISELKEAIHEIELKTNAKKYKWVFNNLKIIYPYLMSIDSLNKLNLEKYEDILTESLKTIIRKTKKEFNEEVITWTLELFKIPAYNRFARDTYTVLRRNGARKCLEKKERASLLLFNQAKNERKVFERIEDEFWIIKRELVEDFNEKEYWFDYHLSILNSLNYTRSEKEIFILYAKDNGIKFNKIESSLKRNHSIDTLTTLYKEMFSDSEISTRKRDEIHKWFEYNNPKFLKSKEYELILKKIVFEDKINAYYMFKEYITLNPKPKKYKKELQGLIDYKKSHDIIKLECAKLLNKPEIMFEIFEKRKVPYFIYEYENYLKGKDENRTLKILIKAIISEKIKYYNDEDEIIEKIELIDNYKNKKEAYKELYEVYKKRSSDYDDIVDFLEKKMK